MLHIAGVIDTLVANRCATAIVDATAAGAAAASAELEGVSSSDGSVFGGPSPSFQAVLEAQREAAKEAFARGVSCLGINVDDLELSSFPGLETIFGQGLGNASVSEGGDGQIGEGLSGATPALQQTV